MVAFTLPSKMFPNPTRPSRIWENRKTPHRVVNSLSYIESMRHRPCRVGETAQKQAKARRARSEGGVQVPYTTEYVTPPWSGCPKVDCSRAKRAPTAERYHTSSESCRREVSNADIVAPTLFQLWIYRAWKKNRPSWGVGVIYVHRRRRVCARIVFFSPKKGTRRARSEGMLFSDGCKLQVASCKLLRTYRVKHVRTLFVGYSYSHSWMVFKFPDIIKIRQITHCRMIVPRRLSPTIEQGGAHTSKKVAAYPCGG